MRLFAASLLASVAAARESYAGQQVLKCEIGNGAAFLDDLAEAQHIDVWKIYPEGTADIRVTNKEERSLIEGIFDCDVHIADLDALVQKEHSNKLKNSQSNDFFSTYQRFETITDKLESMASEHSDLARFIPSIGKSLEGRDIPAIVINGGGEPSEKWTAYFGGGIHAREWISPSSVMYIANYMVENYGSDAELTSIMDKVEFHIVPVQNPDGYEFAHTNNRMWRKNRRDNTGNSMGVDLNRNFDWQWGGASNIGSSDSYQGTAPASEPETQAMQDYMLGLNNSLTAIDFHSYGQYLLRSWGWTFTRHPNEQYISAIGDDMVNAISASGGVRYSSITGAQLYPVTGAHDDWSSGNRDVAARKFVGHGWCFELRDTRSFILNDNQIAPTGEEMVAAVKQLSNSLMDWCGESPASVTC